MYLFCQMTAYIPLDVIKKVGIRDFGYDRIATPPVQHCTSAWCCVVSGHPPPGHQYEGTFVFEIAESSEEGDPKG